MKKPGSKKADAGIDLLVSVLLMVILATLGFFSFKMERPRGWLSAPGLLPLFISGTAFVMFLFIAIEAIRRGALKILTQSSQKGKILKWMQEERTRRALLAALIIAVYFFGLLEFLPFEAATGIFFLVIFSLFWPASSWKQRFLVTICLTLAFAISFRGFFGMLLPGQGDLLGNLLFWLRH